MDDMNHITSILQYLALYCGFNIAKAGVSSSNPEISIYLRLLLTYFLFDGACASYKTIEIRFLASNPQLSH